MKFFENATRVLLLLSIALSAALFGVWEEKVLLFAPLLVSIYLVTAGWLICVYWSGRRASSAAPNRFCPALAVPPGGVPLLLFWLYSAILVPFSVIPYEAKMSTLRMGCYLATYWATANLFSRFSIRKWGWALLFGVFVLIALYSLVQHQLDPSILFGMTRYADYGDRLSGTYICPNHIAHLFQLWIPFCLVFVILPKLGGVLRTAFAFAVPLFLLLIYKTQSRAGLLGLIAALTATAFLLALRKSRRLFGISLLLVPLLAAGLFGALWVGSSMFRDRMKPVVKVITLAREGEWERMARADFRPMTWADSAVMVKDRPLFGFGPGNYGQTFPEYRQRVTMNLRETVHPHNEVLELWIEYGVVGVILIGCALLSVIGALIRLIKTSEHAHHTLPAVALLAALAGSVVHGLFDFELRNFPNALMLLLLAGSAVAPLLRYRATASEPIPFARLRASLQTGTKVVFVGATCFASLWATQVMSSAFLRAWGDRARVAGNDPVAERLYPLSKGIDSQNWRADVGLGQMIFPRRYYELDPVAKRKLALREKSAFERAYQHNTKRSAICYGLGNAELFLGNREIGLRHVREAARLSRFNDYYWRKLGVELRKAERYEEAQVAFEYAHRLDRSNLTTQKNLEWLKKKRPAH